MEAKGICDHYYIDCNSDNGEFEFGYLLEESNKSFLLPLIILPLGSYRDDKFFSEKRILFRDRKNKPIAIIADEEIYSDHLISSEFVNKIHEEYSPLKFIYTSREEVVLGRDNIYCQCVYISKKCSKNITFCQLYVYKKIQVEGNNEDLYKCILVVPIPDGVRYGWRIVDKWWFVVENYEDGKIILKMSLEEYFRNSPKRDASRKIKSPPRSIINRGHDTI